ncbi:hypothetical protein MmiHf6_08010 [Methanimicrococcus hongohii]|uniref:Uncharacterized protein n=1 Tax=Methanimicrococcus hongohii TaxID=3028295 RepID=A0AA96ZSJ5_9EURY|nr:hypothetical protein MmiHf6_08010 [Methanimicrococcus sp. Hf6]
MKWESELRNAKAAADIRCLMLVPIAAAIVSARSPLLIRRKIDTENTAGFTGRT